MRILSTAAFVAALTLIPAFAQAQEAAPDAESIVTSGTLDDVAVEVPAPRKEVRTTVFPIVKYREDGDSKRVKLIDVVIGEGYSYKRDGDRREVEVINLPLVSVLKAERDSESESVKILDIPFFTLAESREDADGDFDNRAIDVPIFGPLFRHRRTNGEEKFRFLIFSHTRNSDTERGHDGSRKSPRQGR